MAFRLKQEFQSGPNSVPQTVKVVANPAVLDPNKTQGRPLRALLLDMVDTMFGLIDRLTTNVVRGADQKVRNLTKRDAIKPQYLVVGMRCYVTNNVTAAQAAQGVDNGGAEFYLLRDSTGPLVAFLDADQDTTDTASGRWVLVTGTRAQVYASYPVYVPANQVIEIGDVKRYTVPTDNVERLFQAKVRQPLAGNGVNNVAPTGLSTDPNWIPFDPIQATLKPRIYLTLSQASDLKANSAVAIGQPYIVDFGPDAQGYNRFLLIDGGEDSDNFCQIGELRVNGATLGLYQGNVDTGYLVPYAGQTLSGTHTVTAAELPAPAITVPNANSFGLVGIEGPGGSFNALVPGNGYTVAGNVLTIQAGTNVQAGEIIHYQYGTGSVGGNSNSGPAYTDTNARAAQLNNVAPTGTTTITFTEPNKHYLAAPNIQFLVDATGAIVGATSFIEIPAGGYPINVPLSGFSLVRGRFKNGIKNRYGFMVTSDGTIDYYIA